MALQPGRDTTVAGSGSLSIVVSAEDESVIDRLELLLVGGPVGFPAVRPATRSTAVVFQVPLGGLAGGSFSYHARARDILGNERVTPAVTVTVQ